MKKFLEKNYKIIVVVILAIGLYFILKLWAVGLYTYCGGGGFIDICIIPNMEYSWISAGYIAVLFLLISIFLIKVIKKTDDKIKKIIIALIVLFMGLIGKQLFFIVSPDFKFYLNKAVYKDKNNNLVDIDKYLEQVTKYCINDTDFNFYLSREDMCGGKFEPNLKTVDEYIKVFEAAKKSDFEYLYYLTYRYADQNVGLKNIIEKYNDDTFYAYVINNSSDLEILKMVYDEVTNEKLKELLKNDIDAIEYYDENVDSFDQDEGYKYWHKLSQDFLDGIKQIPEINYNVF